MLEMIKVVISKEHIYQDCIIKSYAQKVSFSECLHDAFVNEINTTASRISFSKLCQQM